MTAKIYHRAALSDGKGGVSALCFKTPRAINLSKALWTLRDEAVTCPKCRRLITGRASLNAASEASKQAAAATPEAQPNEPNEGGSAASPQGSATVAWPTVESYAGGAAPEGLYGWLRVHIEDKVVSYYPAPVAPKLRDGNSRNEGLGEPTALRAALEADAARYRWLRDALDSEEIPAGLHDAFQHAPAVLDAFIDAALALP